MDSGNCVLLFFATGILAHFVDGGVGAQDNLNGYHKYETTTLVSIRSMGNSSVTAGPIQVLTQNSTFAYQLIDMMRKTGKALPKSITVGFRGITPPIPTTIIFKYNSPVNSEYTVNILEDFSNDETFPYIMEEVQFLSEEFVPEIIFTNGQFCMDDSKRIYRISQLEFTSCTSVDTWDTKSVTFDKCMEIFCNDETANVVTYQPGECHIQTCNSLKQGPSEDTDANIYSKVYQGCVNGSPCENGGTCYHLDPAGFYRKCHCTAGFRGSRCQHEASFGTFDYVLTFQLPNEKWEDDFRDTNSREFKSLDEEILEQVQEGFEMYSRDSYDIPTIITNSFEEASEGTAIDITLRFPAYQDSNVVLETISRIVSRSDFTQETTTPVFISLATVSSIPPSSIEATTTTPEPSTLNLNPSSTMPVTSTDEPFYSTTNQVQTTTGVVTSTRAETTIDIVTESTMGMTTTEVGETTESNVLTETQTTLLFTTSAIACDSNPCQNGGTCQETRAEGFHCMCDKGYYGETCKFVKGYYVYTLRFRITSLEFDISLLDKQSDNFVNLSRRLKDEIIEEYGRLADPDDTPQDITFDFGLGSVVADISPVFVSPQEPDLVKRIIDSILSSGNLPYTVRPPSAEITYTPALFRCDFEVIDLCGMVLEQSGSEIAWIRHSGPTPLTGTGPSAAYSGTHYMYIDTRRIITYSFSDFLLTPQLEYVGQVCLRINYHMKGPNMGHLFVLLRERSGVVQYLWGDGGLTTTDWRTLLLTVNLTAETQQIALQAAPLAGGNGDIALDDLHIDLDMSLCTPDEPCQAFENGPHSDECLERMWIQRCMSSAPGNPVYNFNTREFLNQYNLGQVSDLIDDWADAANKGEEPWLTRCYGSDYLRLVGSNWPGRGRVEVFRDGNWGTVCDDDFDDTDASIICRQLNFTGGEARTDAFFGRGRNSEPIWLYGLSCSGSEESLYECPQDNSFGWTCYHNEDAGVLCKEAITSLESDVGSAAIARPELDTTQSTIFITDTTNAVQKAGRVVRWHFWSTIPNVSVHLQVWRLTSLSMAGEVFTLVSQTVVTTGPRNENRTVVLKDEDTFAVDPGDILGIYFPEQNPIPWTVHTCYSVNEQVRYYYDPEKVTVGDSFTFKLAPLAWRPCRSYSLMATIEHFEVTTTESPPATEAPAPDLPVNAIFGCTFEEPENCSVSFKPGLSGLTWELSGGPTDSLGTGPASSHSGSQYIYLEASFHTEGSTASVTFGPIAHTGDVCVSFYHHMFGAGIGELALKTSSGTEVWRRQGPTLDEWVLVQKEISISDAEEFTFIGALGRTVQGDIAIDDFIVLSGACVPPNFTTPTPTKPTTQSPSGSYPEELIIYVSNNGQDILLCGIRQIPCLTMRQALLRPAKKKIIRIISDDRDSILQFDLTDIPWQTTDVQITGVETERGQQHGILVLGSLEQKRLASLKFNNLAVTGDMDILMCSSDSVEVRFRDCNVGGYTMEGKINIDSCKNLVLRIDRCFIYDYMIEYTAQDTSDVRISNSIISGNYSHWNGTSWYSSGLHGKYPGRNGRHVLRLESSQFLNLGQEPDSEKPGGAVIVQVAKDSSTLKMLVYNCTFETNHRAIDMSLKGATVAEIAQSRFINNHAQGTGGALRFGPTLTPGFGAISTVAKAKLYIQDCEFVNNTATTSDIYTESDVYYQTRSPGSGGAVYVFLTVPSPLPQDGLVSISRCSFIGNSASVHGGTIYNNPGISLEIRDSTIANSKSGLNPNFGAIFYGLCNMTIADTVVDVVHSDGSTPIISYQASDPSNARLLVDGLNMTCPPGYWVEELNTTSFAGAGGIETLQLYCRACSDDLYSLQLSSVVVQETMAYISNPVNCLKCPYGAECSKGIWNKNGFWGRSTESLVSMYQCPEDYCETDLSITPVAYDVCAANREGTLCGRCRSGYSESLFGTECIPDEDCGFQNWFIVLFVVLYGVLYLLFFMFEHDWARFVRYISYKLSRKDKQDDKEEAADAADLGESGYFQSFMYFIQTSDLLKVEIVIVQDEVYHYLHRPQELFPEWLVDGFKKVLNFDILFFQGKTCILAAMTPVLKVVLKFSFVLYLFGILFFLYLVSGFCCFWMPNSKRPRIGKVSMNARMLSTIVALALYTYQAVAEDAFLLLNCASINGQSVLYLDGNVDCLQDWQWAVIILVCVYVIPFFIILLFGPKLLQDRLISLGFFFTSMLFPLFLAPVIILMYFRCMRRKPSPLEGEDEEKVRCCGDREESREAIVSAMVGPYREDLFRGICWEGVINFRRMILVVCFTFINDRLLKQMAMAFVCFIVLIVHIKAKPFKQKFSNYAESASLGMLLIISGTNLVKAAFFHSQTIPRGGNYLVIVIYEWLEALCLGLLPIILLGLVFGAMIIKTASKLIQRSKDDKANDDKSDPPDDSGDVDQGLDNKYNDLSKVNNKFQPTKPYDPYTGFDETARDFPYVARAFKYNGRANNKTPSPEDNYNINRSNRNNSPGQDHSGTRPTRQSSRRLPRHNVNDNVSTVPVDRNPDYATNISQFQASRDSGSNNSSE